MSGYVIRVSVNLWAERPSFCSISLKVIRPNFLKNSMITQLRKKRKRDPLSASKKKSSYQIKKMTQKQLISILIESALFKMNKENILNWVPPESTTAEIDLMVINVDAVMDNVDLLKDVTAQIV